jgi:DNA (cytosine-5)-methyltransferase 1
MSSPKVLDLFAGCGGLSLGLEDAGFEIAAAIEKDDWACATYGANHPRVEVIRRDIRDFSESELRDRFGAQVDLVAGSPPCQGFSVSGPRQYGIYKPDNQLIREFIRVVENLRPPCFLFENVRGLSSASIDGHTQALDLLLERLKTVGYTVSHSVLQAADFGVPQFRSRLFVMGFLDGGGIATVPPRSHGPRGSLDLAPYVTVLEAIRDLARIGPGEGSDDPQEYGTEPPSSYALVARRGSTRVRNHQAMRHTQRVISRFKTIPPGGRSYDIGRRVRAATSVTVYKTNNQRLMGSEPSLCITANWQSNYIHPILDRNLTVREAARLQSFPDSFVFLGKRAVMSASFLRTHGRNAENHISQCHQVGNAVPPLLAAHIGRQLLRELGHRPRTLVPLLEGPPRVH